MEQAIRYRMPMYSYNRMESSFPEAKLYRVFIIFHQLIIMIKMHVMIADSIGTVI